MMAAIVCHHQCLESHTVEPRALRLTLSSSRPRFSPPSLELASKSVSVNSSPEPGGWGVLQTLFDGTPRLSKEIEGNENTYVHQLVKRSLSALSDKSLELCTENLGSETGSDDVLEDDKDIFSLSSSSNPQSENRPTWKQHESQQVFGGKKAIGGNFPPPLTTISRSESIRVRPHREYGRLVIKAEKANNSIFQAERSNGRLRLCILKDSTSSIDYKEETTTDKENGNNNNNNEDEEEKIENDSNTIAEKDEIENEEEMETTKFERREGRDGRGGGVGGRCRGGEHEEQRIYSGFACTI